MSIRDRFRFTWLSAGRVVGLHGATAVVLLGLAWPSPARAEKIHGVSLPTDAVKVGEDRYRSPKRYRKAIRHFRSLFRGKGIVWTPIRGNPRVQGVHIANLRPNRKWDGINVYEADRKVTIYVVKAEDAPQKKQ